MTTRSTAHRRRVPRAGAVRRAQGGTAARGVIVAAGLVAAVALQLAGPRLQCHLADLVGIPSAAPVMAPASIAVLRLASATNPMHPCKVAVAIAGTAPARSSSPSTAGFDPMPLGHPAVVVVHPGTRRCKTTRSPSPTRRAT